MERLDEVHRATVVPGQWNRGAVIAERRMVAATLVDALPAADQKRPRTPPAPPPRPQEPRSETTSTPRTPATNDPLQQLAEG